ncbi:hypothetical protein ACHAXH_000679 [Discostella pseudostelligera]
MSKLWDADPLIVALFDLPDGLQAFSNIDLRANDTASHAKGYGGNRRRSSHDDGIDSGNASPLHGESISFTDADEDYSDAVDQVKPPNNPRPLLFTSFFPNYGPPFEKLPSFNNAGKAISRKKSKKRRPDTIKPSIKIVDRKSARSSFASFGDTESPISLTPSGTSSTFVDDDNQPGNIPQQKVDDILSLDRVTNLKLKIQRIRMSIHSLENDLIATRSELVRAHKHLHFATLELDGIKRAVFEADFGLFRHVQQQERLSSSSRSASGNRLSQMHFFDADNMSARSSTYSNSTDQLHYLTPCSTFDGDESDNSTPRSTGSYDSFYSLTEIDHTNTNFIHARISTEDKDKTPLKRNSKLKQVVLTNATETGREFISICTPSTMATSQDEICIDQRGDVANAEPSGQEERRNKICRHDSFIRAHDLTLSDDVDNNSIVSLQTTDVGDIANALFQLGYECAMDESDRWAPEHGTGKLLSKRAMNGDVDGPIGDWPNAAYGDEVLVWTSKCIHGGHGSEYPLVKARGLIPTSAFQMVELLLDSTRVKEYNKMSLGRVDEHCFATGVERLVECPATGLLGELKIVRSKSQPPVVRKPIELRLLLHARRLPSEDDKACSYLTIGRSIWETDQGTANTDENSVTRCEMLLSVNLIRDVPSSSSSDNQKMCEITTITHGISPGIPISIGKRIGLAAAIKYIKDIRAVFENLKKDS